MAINANLFKQVMRRFATGVMVLTVQEGEERHAVTVNAVASLSLEPLLMLVCIEKNAHSHRLLHSTRHFALNILAEDQRELGERFAYDREARSQPERIAPGRPAENGAWLIDGVLGWLECRVTEQYDGGDHTIFVGEVTNAWYREQADDPLLYYMGKFTRLEKS